METYISLLRGINVSGKNSIKMDPLKKMVEALGLKNVTTYIQSGNVIFRDAENRQKELEKIIKVQIKTDFGFDVTVIVMTRDKLRKIIEKNPFRDDFKKDAAYLHITFLASIPEKYDLESILTKKSEGEEIAILDEAVYLYCPNGYGKTRLTNTFLETKLKTVATTRKLKSSIELLRIAELT
jgi:uncharacterized protein (DUF1697 family)